MPNTVLRKMSWSWILVFLAAIGLAAAAQDKPDKPDFSGRWILDDPRQPGPDIPRTLTISQPIVRTNVFGAPMPPAFLELAVARQFENEVRSDTYFIGTGGVTGGFVAGNGRPAQTSTRTETRLQWRGDRLLIETGRYAGPTRDSGPYTEHNEEWWLDDQGKLRMIVVDRRSDSEAETHTLAYRRQ
jgi:hypothetical protein